MTPTEALGAACWNAQAWLGGGGLAVGVPADLVVYEQDPRTGPQVLAQPSLVMVGGEVVTTRGSLA